MHNVRVRFVLALLLLFVASSASAAPTRVRYMPGAELYVPAWFAPSSEYDLVLFFHGLPHAMDDAFDRARPNALLVSVNLGEGSGPFEKQFRDPRAFDSLLAATQRELEKTGRAPNAKLGRVALVAWSAGFGAVGAILSQPANAARVDAVLLADGLHTNYVGAFVADKTVLRKYAEYAERAMKGERLFAFTHSSVRAPGYASTSDCAKALLEMTGAPRTTATKSLHGARGLYEAHRGDFHVFGFAGGSVEEHRDHLRYIDETMLPLLIQRWRQKLQ
jgi:hypothetical protein